jgi:hypothetical protein
MLKGKLGRAAILAISLAALLSACGSSSGAPSAAANAGSFASLAAAAGAPTDAPIAVAAGAPGSAAGSTDPACALVKPDAVGTAGGFSVADYSGAGGTCIFQNSDRSKYLSVQLFKSQAEMATYLQLESSSEHIAGLGDDAFWTSGMGGLFVRKGDRAIEFTDPDFALSSDTDTAPRDALVALAQTAVPNL